MLTRQAVLNIAIVLCIFLFSNSSYSSDQCRSSHFLRYGELGLNIHDHLSSRSRIDLEHDFEQMIMLKKTYLQEISLLKYELVYVKRENVDLNMYLRKYNEKRRKQNLTLLFSVLGSLVGGVIIGAILTEYVD